MLYWYVIYADHGCMWQNFQVRQLLWFSRFFNHEYFPRIISSSVTMALLIDKHYLYELQLIQKWRNAERKRHSTGINYLQSEFRSRFRWWDNTTAVYLARARTCARHARYYQWTHLTRLPSQQVERQWKKTLVSLRRYQPYINTNCKSIHTRRCAL